ncbi:hypothetical protein ACFLSE_08780 [Bacteroidota bacterium]
MKKLTFLILMLSFIGFYSCSNTGKEKSKATEEQINEKNACDEFLEQYEGWIDEYLEVIDSYFNDPSDETMAAKYMALMQEGIEWSTKWIALVECADDEKYKQRFEDISKEVEKKMSELGL